MNILSIIQILVFVLGSILIFYISRRSLLNFKVHGSYRFFVFEFTLALVLFNIPHWFDSPFSVQQIISWILLLYSGLLLIQSIYFFKKYGGSREKRKDSVNLDFENTVPLIQEGIYKYVRHPMYGSLLFLALGAMFKYISIITIFLAVLISVFVFFTAIVEEKENLEFFGSGYKDYMKKTKMFIPYIF